MREILFRGKRADNGEWIEGSLWSNYGEVKILSALNAIGYEVIPETVGQYTGLTDKNGKQIFEGDVIDASEEWWHASGPAGHDSPILEVEWDEYYCGFAPFAVYDCDCGVYIEAKGCKIIGNIHDNPELLKGGED